MVESLLEKYKDVKTGQDLVDRGVVPKSSAQMLAWIAFSRLQNIHAGISATVQPEMFGEWVPAFSTRVKNIQRNEVTGEAVSEYARQGMRVRGSVRAGGRDRFLEGTIMRINSTYFDIEWDERPDEPTPLEGVRSGYGSRKMHSSLTLLVPGGIVPVGYELADGVVANDKLGHLVQFTQEYKTNSQYGRAGVVPSGTRARLIGYRSGGNSPSVALRFEGGVQGLEKEERFAVSNIADILRVSSLGQVEPKNLEEEVMRNSFMQFFPRTVLDLKTARQIIVGLLMQKDMIFYGPPGSGKSEAARDLVSIAQQQGVIFHVDGCNVQCSPYSLFDADFERVVPACPECKINYSPEFQKTGIFTRPSPKDVKVVVANFGEGKGIEHVEGTRALQRMHLAGYKLPNLDGSVGGNFENDFDPKGFHAGLLSRTNNGILHAEELDKWRPDAWDNLLDTAQNNRIKPDQLRFSYPASSVLIATANDASVFPGTINDRMLLIPVNYPQDRDDSFRITLRSYHGLVEPVEAVGIANPHEAHNDVLRRVPMPAIIERAVDAFYILFRNGYTGPGRDPILGSNRSKLDALDAARAEHRIDSIFLAGTPDFANAEYAMRGIEFALSTRVNASTTEKAEEIDTALSAYVRKEFPEILRQEEDTWWCRTYQSMAVRDTQAPGIDARFRSEVAQYKADPSSIKPAFEKVKAAQNDKDNLDLGQALLEHPFMAHLFREQPKIGMLQEKQLVSLISYFMESQARSTCQ